MGEDEDEYRPRETDHLVEPMFAGLGAGEERGDGEERAGRRRGCLLLVAAVLPLLGLAARALG